MRTGGRLRAAIEVLADIEARRRPVADALKDWGLSHRFAGSGDRAVIGNIVYDCLRWRASSAWMMADETPRALVLATVGRRWSRGAAGLAAAVADDAHAPPPLTEDEARRIDTADLAQAPAHVRADIPEWLAPRFERVFGPDWVAEGEALARRPPLDLRANRLKADRAKVVKALSRFAAAEIAVTPDGVRIAPSEGEGRHPNLQAEPGFRKGWFEIQDAGSQIAATLVNAGPGQQILDLCAGAGGKTLALAAAMANKGQVFATDSDRTRLAPIFERLRRGGTRNVQVREAGASLDDLEGRMDAVLIDAPCTGTGTWRRRPDAKWRLTEAAIANRVAEQAGLLQDGARFVRPGGRLIYVTCTVLKEENEDRIAMFCETNHDFTPIAASEMLRRAGDAVRIPAGSFLALAHGLQLTPHRTATDGFYVAGMTKAG